MSQMIHTHQQNNLRGKQETKDKEEFNRSLQEEEKCYIWYLLSVPKEYCCVSEKALILFL